MAARRIKVSGMGVQVWEKSFRIDGMTHALHVGEHASDKVVGELITTIYNHVRDQAEKDGLSRARRRLVAAVSKLTEGSNAHLS